MSRLRESAPVHQLYPPSGGAVQCETIWRRMGRAISAGTAEPGKAKFDMGVWKMCCAGGPLPSYPPALHSERCDPDRDRGAGGVGGIVVMPRLVAAVWLVRQSRIRQRRPQVSLLRVTRDNPSEQALFPARLRSVPGSGLGGSPAASGKEVYTCAISVPARLPVFFTEKETVISSPFFTFSPEYA